MEQRKRRHVLMVSGCSISHGFRILTNLPLLAVLFLAFSVVGFAQLTAEANERDQGVKLYQQGDFDGAVKALRAATKKSKTDHVAWHYLGLALSNTGDVKAARKAFEKAIQLRPDFAPSHTALAYTLLGLGKPKEALTEVRTALFLDAKDGQAHYVFGTLLLRSGDCHAANSQAELAKTNDPSFASAYLLKSQTLLCDREPEGFGPTSVPRPELSKEEKLATAKRSALRFREAADNLEKYLQLQPNSVEAPMWREQLSTLHVYAEPAEKSEDERTVFVGPEVTTKARVLSKPEPTYTEAARRAQVVGTIVLRAVFAADGTVKNILIMSGLPYGLTQQAVAAARKIKFIPATRNGQPAAMFIQLEYNFNLY